MNFILWSAVVIKHSQFASNELNKIVWIHLIRFTKVKVIIHFVANKMLNMEQTKVISHLKRWFYPSAHIFNEILIYSVESMYEVESHWVFNLCTFWCASQVWPWTEDPVMRKSAFVEWLLLIDDYIGSCKSNKKNPIVLIVNHNQREE